MAAVLDFMMNPNLNQGLVVALVLAAGCASPAAPAPSTAGPPPPATTQVAKPAPIASPPSSEPTPTPPDLGPSPFHIAGEHTSAVHIFPMGDVAFLLVDGNLLLVRDGLVSFDRTFQRGLPSGPAYEQFVLAGEWPDTAFVVAARTDHNHRRTELFFWDGHRWKSKLQTRRSTQIQSLGPWNLRRVLALLQDVQTGKPSFQVIAGFPLDPIPTPDEAEGGCDAKVLLKRAAVLRSGHVFAAGKRCGGKGLAVQQWEPGKKKGELYDLPDSGEAELADVVAQDEKTAFVAGASKIGEPAYFAAFSGDAWVRRSVPMTSGIARLRSDSEGTLWAVTTTGALWARRQGSFTPVPLPPVPGGKERIQAVDVWPRSAQDTWVVGRYQAGDGDVRTVLMHTRPHDGPVPFVPSQD